MAMMAAAAEEEENGAGETKEEEESGESGVVSYSLDELASVDQSITSLVRQILLFRNDLMKHYLDKNPQFSSL